MPNFTMEKRVFNSKFSFAKIIPVLHFCSKVIGQMKLTDSVVVPNFLSLENCGGIRTNFSI